MSNEPQIESDIISSEHGIARREWLATFAVAGVAAAAASLPKVASSQAHPHADDPPDLELRHIKAALEPLRTANYVQEAQRRGILDMDIDDVFAADINQFLGTTYQALVYSELVNALPEKVRSSDEVQADIAAMSPVLDQALADAYFVIDGADDDIKHEIDRELRRNPDLLMDMSADLDREGAKHGMGVYGRLRLRRVSAHLSSRLHVQSTHELVADVTDKLTRIAERNETKRSDGARVEASPAAKRMLLSQVDTTSDGDGCHEPLCPEDDAARDGLITQPATASETASPEEDQTSSREQRRLERHAKRLKRASIGLAGTGAGLLIAGGVALGITGAIGAAVPITFGALAILLALFILGAAVRRRKEAEKARSSSMPGP